MVDSTSVITWSYFGVQILKIFLLLMVDICPRLFDYVIFVGTHSFNKVAVTHTPEILCRFPPTDHQDFLLPIDVSFFCQPEGCLQSPIRNIKYFDTVNTFQNYISFVFSLTDKDTSKTRYGVCTNFMRPIYKLNSKNCHNGIKKK